MGLPPIAYASGNSDLPKAYLNYIFINRNYDLSSVKPLYVRIYGEGEDGTDGPHAHLTLEDVITEPGYVYVYLSNDGEEEREVYFDDFKVEHVKSPVIESSDYYPFGLTYNNYQRENSLINRKKFQSQEHVDDLGLNWDSFKWRNHQPDIGRFFNVDPLAEKYYYNSPYAFSENKVTGHVELEGLESVKAAMDQALSKFRGTFESLLGTTFDDSKKTTQTSKGGQEKKDTRDGNTVTIDGKGGRNESDLPDGSDNSTNYSFAKDLFDAVAGVFTKSKPDKNRSPTDQFKNAKSAADNMKDSKDASEGSSPAALDTIVAQTPYTNGGNYASEMFVIGGGDTTLLIIYSPNGDGKNPDSTYSRKSNSKEYERIRNGDWHGWPKPSRPQ